MVTLYLACSETIHDSTPQLLLARLRSTHALQQLIELHHPARREAEGGSRVTHDRDEVVKVARLDVVDAMVQTLRVPRK